MRCPECELVYLSPRPNQASIHLFYPDDYAPHQSNKVKKNKKTSKEFSSLPPHPNARLLDYGCGSGAFLKKMQDLGWDSVGLDSSDNAVKSANSLGLKAFKGDFKHPEIAGMKFECITMRQVLEHLHNPIETLLEAKKHLVSKGRLSVSVPNIESLAYRWFKENWLGIDHPRHLLFFSPKSLQRLLKKTGFKVLDLRQIRHSNWLRESACNEIKARGMTVKSWLGSRKLTSSAISLWAQITNQSDCIQVLAEEDA